MDPSAVVSENDNTIPPLNLKPAGNQRESDNGAGDTDHERD
jgi:hypothetical protein